MGVSPFFLFSRPGNLKRGMTSVSEESTMKRSRTSSISSGTGAHASRGGSGTRRNAIQSSYSSSIGLSQVFIYLLFVLLYSTHSCKDKFYFFSCYLYVYLHSVRKHQHQALLCPVLDHLALKLQREPPKDPGLFLAVCQLSFLFNSKL